MTKFGTVKSPTKSGIPAFSITNDENPEIIQQILNWNYSFSVWFAWMVCCVKLNRLLWFMAFAGVSVFISVSLSFFLSYLFVKCILCFVIIRTIKPFDRFAHIVALAWFMLLFVYKFFAVVCRLHRSIGNNQSELRKNSTVTSGVRFLYRGSRTRILRYFNDTNNPR